MCILKLLHSQFNVYQSLCWCWEVYDPHVFVFVFIFLGSNANMTMCALDTRNDSKGDTNAVTYVPLQFSSSLITHSVHHIPMIVLTCFQP